MKKSTKTKQSSKGSSNKVLKSIFLTAIGFGILTQGAFAFKSVSGNTTSTATPTGNIAHLKVAVDCDPGRAQTDLDINNVRTKILTGGDMWWDLDNQKYEIPKGSNLHSLFAGSLWIGGIDAGGQLKVAAMTYRQGGNDFFPGPLDLATASISAQTCSEYDKHWKITREEVQSFLDTYGTGAPVPNSIATWPGNGNSSQSLYLAPFNDVNGDGVYDPSGSGDYPNYDISGSASCTACNESSGNIDPNYKDLLFGDQTLWWVFNDVGNIHSESGAEPIGLEIQAQAFAFSTNDEINNMTFYQYKIINRSTYSLNDTYFGQWVDADLGYAFDDYVGCDVERGLGYAFNGDSYDESSAEQNGYGFNPPAVGVDFFQGPLADATDGIDNNRNCIVDEKCEQIIMSKFVYYNNTNLVTGNPSSGTQFYNYLRGIWRDGSKMTYGGSGHLSGGAECDFMFPGDSDFEYQWGTGGTCASPAAALPEWDERGSGNLPEDRRFLQSAGVFTLAPGAVNYITTGVVWARASSGDNYSALPLLKQVDDKAQALFDNCFKVPNGPDAPDLAIRELKNELILSWSNKPSSNNFKEGYNELDPTIQNLHYEWIDNGTLVDTTVLVNRNYKFQGYQIFQLKDAFVTITDIHNLDKARLLFQCDVKDGVTSIVNYNFNQITGANEPILEVVGEDKGIIHSLSVKTDLFASGTTTIVNHKSYYYTIIAYGYNQFKQYKQDQVPIPTSPLAAAYDGQKKPYFPGRRNIKTYGGIPHHPAPNNNGQELNAKYGDSPMLKRIEGTGNGGNELQFTQATIDEIMSSNDSRSLHPVYEKNHGPVKIKVYDPVAVPLGDFTFRIVANDTLQKYIDTANWVLTNNTTGVSVSSETTIRVGNEQLIPEWGLSVMCEQIASPGPLGDINGLNGFISDTTEVADKAKDWFTGVPDLDGFVPDANWIRSGTYVNPNAPADDDYYSASQNPPGFDPNQIYEKVVVKTVAINSNFSITGGTWAPYRLCAYSRANDIPGGGNVLTGPAWFKNSVMKTPPSSNESDNIVVSGNRMKDLQSVDVVLTSDKSKWTRAVVLEAGDTIGLTEGATAKLDLRVGASVGKDGKSDGDGTGMSWFPGYAYSLETGERLNIMFAENSWLTAENGRDMIWNPTHRLVDNQFNVRVGGSHYIYIMNTKYDACARYRGLLSSKIDTSKARVFKEAGWVSIPLVSDEAYSVKPGELFVPPSEYKIKIRVTKHYATYNTGVGQNRNLPLYSFNTKDLFTDMNNKAAAKNALDLINIVPNPYYAYSSYEQKGLDNIVKITNLPSNCEVSIYTINGNLIRRFNRNVAPDVSPGSVVTKENLETSILWDLTNDARTPVSSGVYLVHVKVDGVGERVIKWFGAMRPIDLDTY